MSEREILITKEYKTMGGFLRGCRAVLKNVWDDSYGDTFTMITDHVDKRTIKERIHAGEFVVYDDGDEKYKIGFEFEFPDRIYAFCIDR